MKFTEQQLEDIGRRKVLSMTTDDGHPVSVVEMSSEEFKELVFLAGHGLSNLVGTTGYEQVR